LLDGTEIVVKLLLPKTQQETQEFSDEVANVTSVSHKNLVKLSSCSFGDLDQLSLYMSLLRTTMWEKFFLVLFFYPTIGRSNPIENKRENNSILLIFNVIL